MAIYHLRIIERLWGSRKFASFLLAILPPTLLLPPILLALVLRPLSLNALNSLPAGPTPLIYALLVQYHAAIPTIYKYRLAASSSSTGQHDFILSDKSLNYLVAGQLALSSLPGSLIAAVVGWGVGIAWRGELGPGGWARWRLPEWISEDSIRRREEFEGLRLRLEGESRGMGNAVEAEREAEADVRRRTLGGGGY